MPSGTVTPAGGGGGLPAQWVVAPTGALTLTTTGATTSADYGPIETIVNASGKTIFSSDSAGEVNFTACQSDIGVVTVNVDPATATLLPRASVLALYNDSTSGLGWWFTGTGHEAHGTRAAPVDANVHASEAWDWYDATNGAAKFGRRGKTADGTVVQTLSPMAPPITSGALPTATLVSGTGAQIALNRDARTVTPVTFNPTGAATATCLVQLSPDNVTYSTLVTKTFPVSVTLAGSVDEVSVIVPAGWYLKLTATNATLGATTYY